MRLSFSTGGDGGGGDVEGCGIGGGFLLFFVCVVVLLLLCYVVVLCCVVWCVCPELSSGESGWSGTSAK